MCNIARWYILWCLKYMHRQTPLYSIPVFLYCGLPVCPACPVCCVPCGLPVHCPVPAARGSATAQVLSLCPTAAALPAPAFVHVLLETTPATVHDHSQICRKRRLLSSSSGEFWTLQIPVQICTCVCATVGPFKCWHLI